MQDFITGQNLQVQQKEGRTQRKCGQILAVPISFPFFKLKVKISKKK